MTLEARALDQFDKLVQQGEILWQDTGARYVASEFFDFQFRVASALANKPRSIGSRQAKHAFADDSEDFDLGRFGARHKLILNKYCVVRPQLVLHTIDFEPQGKLLSAEDLYAAWLALTAMGTRYMVIYNSGKDAGASVNHKHLQILPRTERGGLESLIDDPNNTQDHSYLKHLPYRVSARTLPEHPDGARLSDLVSDLRQETGLKDDDAFNLIMFHDRLLVIPRTKVRMDGVPNAAGMMGVVWCSSEEEYEGWLSHGPLQLLQAFGVPSKN